MVFNGGKGHGFLSSQLRIGVLVAGLGAIVGLGIYYYTYHSSSIKTRLKKKKKSPPDSQASLSTETTKGQPEQQHSEEGQKDLSQKDLSERYQSLKTQGNLCFNKSDYEQAIQYYDKAFETLMTTTAMTGSDGQLDDVLAKVVIYSNKAACYDRLSSYALALEECNKGLALSPLYVKCLDRRAGIYEKTGRLYEAVLDYTACSLVEPNSKIDYTKKMEGSLQRLAEKKALEGPLNKTSLPSSSVIHEYFDGFAPISIDTSLEIINENFSDKTPNTALNYLNRAKFYLKQGKFSSALSDLENAYYSIDTSTEHNIKAECQNLLGSLEYLRGNKTMAQSLFQASLESKASSEVKFKLASLLLEGGLREKALELTEEALLSEPGNVYFLYQAAELLYVAEDYEGANKRYSLAIKAQPLFYISYIHKSRVLLILEKYEEAVNLIKDSLKLFPSNTKIVNLYVELLFYQQKIEEATELIEKLFLAYPQDPQTLFNKALIAPSGGGSDPQQNLELCIELLKKVIQIDPAFYNAYVQLSSTYIIQGNKEESYKYLEKALTCAKTYPELLSIHWLLLSSKYETDFLNKFPQLSDKLKKFYEKQQQQQQNSYF